MKRNSTRAAKRRAPAAIGRNGGVPARAGSTPPWHSLEGKRIWVTGGAGYLGTPITEALDYAGARSVRIDLDGRADALVQTKRLRQTVPVAFDVCDASSVGERASELMREHGVPDGVVHLAYASSAGKRLVDLSPAEFQRTFDLTLPATFVLCRTVAEAMKPRAS